MAEFEVWSHSNLVAFANEVNRQLEVSNDDRVMLLNRWRAALVEIDTLRDEIKQLQGARQ